MGVKKAETESIRGLRYIISALETDGKVTIEDVARACDLKGSDPGNAVDAKILNPLRVFLHRRSGQICLKNGIELQDLREELRTMEKSIGSATIIVGKRESGRVRGRVR